MPEQKISDLFRIRNRFLRSADLERDFKDPDVLAGYIATDFTGTCLARVAEGLKANSGHRAWRVTGDYGSGKSSFALLLAHCFAGREANFPPQIRKVVDQVGFSTPHFLPVLVTCARHSLAKSILNSLKQALQEIYRGHNTSKILVEINRLLENEPTDDQVLRVLLEVNSRIIIDSKAKGLLLIIDELGKYLEYAALHSDRQDVFLLQRIAEAASRSRYEPLFIISLVHQGFDTYADRLTQSAQREWQKVAGRFEEIVFDLPIEQTAQLISSALNVAIDKIPKTEQERSRRAMGRAIALGWFGRMTTRGLSDVAAHLYPLHPTVLPVLIRLFRRFGQNERSLFSFLLSNEPFGLRFFGEQRLKGADVYRLHNLYDYVRTNFGQRLASQSYRSHWNLIDSVVDSFGTEDELQIRILKTVGILNLLNENHLSPIDEAVTNALTNDDAAERKAVREAVGKLQRGKRVLYDRGRTRGLSLWPHTSADLEKAYDEASRAVGTPRRVISIIKNYIEAQPIVARRHYIETGNLRHWEVRYTSVNDLLSLAEQPRFDADGLILVPLCETPAEQTAALKFAGHPKLRQCESCLLAVSQPLSSLAPLVQEVQRWEWIAANTKELSGDKYAREEVSRQRTAAVSQLKHRIESFLGLKASTNEFAIQWFHLGKALKIANGRELVEKLSEIFDVEFRFAPRIKNELINRRNPSSAAVAARMRLTERILSDPNSAFIGLDQTKAPPEMSMYLSVLRNTGIHQGHDGSWRIGEPTTDKDKKSGRVLPTFRRIREIVDNTNDRVNVESVFDELRRPPYGVRDGILPLLLTVFAVSHKEDIAFYKDGTFVPELTAALILELTKAPERFEMQYCEIRGLRAEVFERLLTVLSIKRSKDRSLKLLKIVKSLCVFVAQLPEYTRNTKRLSNVALAVRDAILNARDPAKLIFSDLPLACNGKAILATEGGGRSAQEFVRSLSKALDTLRSAFPELEDRLIARLQQTFEIMESGRKLRTPIATRARSVVLSVTEPKLKAFCLRLMDDRLSDSNWLESLGSYLALKPPSKWHDAEEDKFAIELEELAARFRRMESVVFAKEGLQTDATGIRVAITQSNGFEHERVVHFTPEETKRVRQLQNEFETLLKRNKRLGLAAASQALWTMLGNGNQHDGE